MKTPLLLALILLSTAACKKNSDTNITHCEHCQQYVTDSATGNLIEIKDGGSASTYCDGTLDLVKAQHAVYFHNTVAYSGGVSRCQKYEYHCQ